ncbi:hypothetical protein P7C71_g990, partial [Lecanoromycetidae sp. Uapishka_2]
MGDTRPRPVAYSWRSASSSNRRSSLIGSVNANGSLYRRDSNISNIVSEVEMAHEEVCVLPVGVCIERS